MSVLAYLLTRFKEPSTYAGVGALFAATGVHLNTPILQTTIQTLVSIAGLVAMLIPEKNA